MSKRKMLRLVEEGHVNGWDDPRMPTLQGMRRRGYTSKSIRDFCEKVGVAKRENVIEVELLEHCLRHDLNLCSPRRLGVLDPLKVTISNYPEDKVRNRRCGKQSGRS
jgi:glutaminyl-tRNA synthetase